MLLLEKKPLETEKHSQDRPLKTQGTPSRIIFEQYIKGTRCYSQIFLLIGYTNSSPCKNSSFWNHIKLANVTTTFVGSKQRHVPHHFLNKQTHFEVTKKGATKAKGFTNCFFVFKLQHHTLTWLHHLSQFNFHTLQQPRMQQFLNIQPPLAYACKFCMVNS